MKLRTVKWIFLGAVLYLALTANFELANGVVGLAVGLLVAMLRPRPATGEGSLPWTRWLPALAALVQYAIVLLWDMWRSGLIVARAVLRRQMAIDPGIVALPSCCRTPLGQAWTAHSVSVTPGELVVAIREDGTLLVHCLDQRRRETAARAVQTRAERYLRRLLPGESGA
ncbi:MAG: Na+/H+ antiporter subunit E [Verrucomicrobiae bacterium]|nr:Na+/H+ antiporter subunit E [Verrucomicrobiae bacterium]